MSAGSKTCGDCGHANTADAMFCSKCGSRLPANAVVSVTQSATAPTAAVTLASPTFEATSGSLENAPAPATPSQRIASARTIVGFAQQQEPDAAAATTPEPSHYVSDPPAGVTDKPSPARRIAGSSRTMLGMPAPQAAAIAEAVRQARAQGESRAAEAAPAVSEPAPVPHPASHAADLHAPGLPAPELPPSKSKTASVGPTNRTMLGQPVPTLLAGPEPVDGAARAPHVTEAPASRGRTPVVYPSSTSDEDVVTLPKKKSGGFAIAMLVAGALVLLVVAGALLTTLVASGSSVRASVVQGDSGEMLEIEVPGAPAGTRVRFRGSEQALAAGRARFPLAADDLALGDNELTVDVVAPDGTVDSETIALHLEMRVRADLGPLESAPPAIDVIVEAPPGSQATLDGQALKLDAHGRGTRRITIDGSEANAEGVVLHIVRWRVVPPEGQAAQGVLRTRIPLTTMQLDRPGEDVVTEATSVEVAGAVAPGSTVTVAGNEVEVSLGRFLTTYPLPSIGEHTIEVVARARGKAPRIQRIRVRRVADLEAEAARFQVNRELGYARIAQNPTTYRGQNVELTGVVYNVDVRNGRSVLQILVDGCPDGERCPLWVTYPAATDAQLRDRVRVLGTISGEQQFRSQRGEIRTVPRVDAVFVLPAPAAAARRR